MHIWYNFFVYLQLNVMGILYMSKILVTGASGNVGRNIVHFLSNVNQNVIAAGTHSNSLAQQFRANIECRFLDFSKQECFEDALRDIERIFIMRPPQMGKPEDLMPFIEYMKKKDKVKFIVFLSLIGIEKNPMPPHHKIEKYIVQSEIPYCFLRPSFFMQNLSGVHGFEIKHFDTIAVPVGKAFTSFIDAEDIGEIAAKILSEPDKHQCRAYDLTGPEAIDYYEAAKIFTEELNRDITYRALPSRLMLNYWIKIRGLDAEYAKVMNMLYRMTRMGTAKRVTDDFEKVMGKKPHDFRTFVRRNQEVWEK